MSGLSRVKACPFPDGMQEASHSGCDAGEGMTQASC